MLGLIGRLRNARPGEVTDNHFRAWKDDPGDVFRVGLRRSIVRARNELPQAQFEGYFNWLATQLAGLGFSEFPATPKSLDGVFDAKKLPATTEFEFAARRLGPQVGPLSLFEITRHLLAISVVAGDQAAARGFLEVFEKTFGPSLWLYETGLAVRQALEGLEPQKRYSEEVRAPLRRSICSYLVRQASVRNEPSTTWPRFREDQSARVTAFAFSEAATAYMRYRLFGESFANADEALATIAAAQSYPLIDLYVTLKDVVSWAALSPSGSALIEARKLWVAPIEAKIQTALAFGVQRNGEDGQHIQRPVSEAVAAIVEGKLCRAYRIAAREIHSGNLSASLIVIIAICAIEAPRPLRRMTGVMRTLVDDLRSVALGSDSWQVGTSSARKLTQNFRGLPIFDSLRIVVEFLARPSLQGAPAAFASLREYITPSAMQPEVARSSFEALVRAVAFIVADDLASAATSLRGATGRGSTVADRIANTLLIDIAVVRGETIDAARLLAREASRAPHAAGSLPTEAVLPSPRWSDLKAHASELFPSIVMDLRWKSARDDRTASIRRFAFNEFLRLQGVTRPTHLESQLNRFDRDELVYFLRNVCVSNVMDMSSFFSTLADVEDEVIAIQSWLTRLDPVNRHEYDARRLELTNTRAIHEGLRIVDSSRIHVDIEAITAWAQKELAEYFARYVELVGAGIGVADDLSTVIKQLTADAQGSLELPSSEADAILIEQTQRLQEQFLHNPEHGLDSYLSRRVRHHPLTATLRSPVEFANLITTRLTEFGPYRDNVFWLDRLGLSGDWSRGRASAAFKEFAVEFDQILTDLKEQRFHVRTAEKPNGLFDADIGPFHHHLLRAVVQLDFSIDTYISEALGIFSARLEYSLSKAREYLNGPVKQQVAACFDRLRAQLQVAREADCYSELATVCSDAAAAVQRKLFEVSEWLSREEGLAFSKTFSLSQMLEIGIRSALDPHKEYRPAIDLRLQGGDIQMPATNVALVSEFLLVILNNARIHGGINVGQDVIISCTVDLVAHTLTLRVVSNVDASARSAAKDRKVRELISAVRTGRFDRTRVRREGNSGFVKIASIVSQSKVGRLDFGFVDETTFFVEVVYSLLIISEASA